MKIHRRQILYFSFTFFFALGIAACRSAPPNDLADPLQGSGPKTRLNEDDLVYTDNTKPLPDPEKDFATIKVDILGRSAPGREGKAIVKLHRGERVNVLKPSADRRWYAIVTLKTRRKAWVPLSAVKVPPATGSGLAPGNYPSGGFQPSPAPGGFVPSGPGPGAPGSVPPGSAPPGY